MHIQPSSAKTLDYFLPLGSKFFPPAEAAILEDTLSVNQTRQQSVYRSGLGADSRVLYQIREARKKHLFAGGWIFQCKWLKSPYLWSDRTSEISWIFQSCKGRESVKHIILIQCTMNITRHTCMLLTSLFLSANLSVLAEFSAFYSFNQTPEALQKLLTVIRSPRTSTKFHPCCSNIFKATLLRLSQHMRVSWWQ